MFLFAVCVVPILVVTRVGDWPAVLLIGFAGAAHQAWSANLFTTVSDMFPKKDVGTIVGLGGLAGSTGAMLFPWLSGKLLDQFHAAGNATGGYAILFGICAFMYLAAFGLHHLLAPRFEPITAAGIGAALPVNDQMSPDSRFRRVMLVAAIVGVRSGRVCARRDRPRSVAPLRAGRGFGAQRQLPSCGVVDRHPAGLGDRADRCRRTPARVARSSRRQPARGAEHRVGRRPVDRDAFEFPVDCRSRMGTSPRAGGRRGLPHPDHHGG